jgi:hypothetical protein
VEKKFDRFKQGNRASITEVEYSLALSNGNTYDVLLQLGYERNYGYYAAKTYFAPNSNVIFYESQLQLDLRCELAQLADQAFNHYLTENISELETSFFGKVG